MIRIEDKDGDLFEVGVDVEGGDRRLPLLRGSNGSDWSLGVGGIRRNRKNDGTEKQPGFMWATFRTASTTPGGIIGTLWQSDGKAGKSLRICSTDGICEVIALGPSVIRYAKERCDARFDSCDGFFSSLLH
jgi:hypothetical protein